MKLHGISCPINLEKYWNISYLIIVIDSHTLSWLHVLAPRPGRGWMGLCPVTHRGAGLCPVTPHAPPAQTTQSTGKQAPASLWGTWTKNQVLFLIKDAILATKSIDLYPNQTTALKHDHNLTHHWSWDHDFIFWYILVHSSKYRCSVITIPLIDDSCPSFTICAIDMTDTAYG